MKPTTRRRSTLRTLLPFAGALLFAARALAEAAGPVLPYTLSIRGCPAELADSLPAVIQLEIDVLLRESEATRRPPERISIECDAGRATIVVGLSQANVESNLDIAALAPAHRARAIALSAAELAHSLFHRDVLAPAAQKPAPEPAPRAAPSAAPEPARRSSNSAPNLVLAGVAEWLGEPTALLLGARLGGYYPLGSLVVPALSLDGAIGTRSTPSADIDAKTLGLSAHLYFGASTGPIRWDAGPGARVAWAALSGRPSADSALVGRSLSAVWAGPELRARVAYATARTRGAVLALEFGAGLIVLPVRGLRDGSERVYALEGHWLSLCAGVGLAL